MSSMFVVAAVGIMMLMPSSRDFLRGLSHDVLLWMLRVPRLGGAFLRSTVTAVLVFSV